MFARIRFWGLRPQSPTRFLKKAGQKLSKIALRTILRKFSEVYLKNQAAFVLIRPNEPHFNRRAGP